MTGSTERQPAGAGGWRAGLPRRPDRLLDRPRLYEQLETTAAITTVAAAAGAGKTTLLRGWADTHSGNLVWLAADRHGAQFWSHLAAVLPPRAQPPEAAVELSHLDAPLVLVIDEAGELDPATVAALLEALDTAPLLRLVVAGRDLRRFDIAPALVRYDRVAVPAADLDFTLDETFTLLHDNEVFGQDETIQLLHTMSHGNPAVLRAATVALANSPWAGPADATRQITEMVAGAVLPPAAALDADPPFRQFLHDTAVANTLDVELAAALSDVDDAPSYLDRAVELGLGVWLDRRRFAYSGAAGLVLRAAAKRADPARSRRLGVAAARWSHRHGQLVDAFRLAIENEDYATAERQVRDGVLHLLLQVRTDTRALLETLPHEKLLRHPLLAFQLALIYNTDRERRPRVQELLTITLAGLRNRSYRSNTADELMGHAVQAICLRAVGRPEDGVGPARAALALVPRLNSAERANFGRSLPVTLAHSALTLLYAGEYPEAITAFGTAHAHASPNTLGRLMGLSMASGALALLGEIPDARATVELIHRGTWPAPTANYGVSFFHIAEALMGLEQMEIDVARAALRRAIEVERFTDQHWELQVYVEALVDIFDGQPLGAVERIDSGQALGTDRNAHGPFLAGLLTATRATAQLAAGLPTAALTTLEGQHQEAIPVMLARARVLLAMDLVPEAVAELGRVERAGRLYTRQRADLLALGTAAALRRSMKHAVSTARELAAILTAHALTTPLALLPPADIARLRALADVSFDEQRIDTITSVIVSTDVLHLTPREVAVLDMLAVTGSAAEIAAALYISVPTVKTHLRNIYQKLGINSREEALALAARVTGTDRRRRHRRTGP